MIERKHARSLPDTVLGEEFSQGLSVYHIQSAFNNFRADGGTIYVRKLSVVIRGRCTWDYSVTIKIRHITRSAINTSSLVELHILLDTCGVTSLNICY